MSSDKGDTQALARLLSNLLDGRTLHGQDVRADPNATAETVNGHAISVSYDGREYTVIVTLSSSQLAADEFSEYGS